MGGPVLFSHHTSASRGVAILFPSTLDHKILKKYTDNDGRLLIIKCNLEKSCYIITNCYAPTQQYRNDQLNFIHMSRDILCKFENESIIATGDFNFYLDPKMDKSDSMSHKYDNCNYRTETQAMLDVFNFVDTWRALNPNSRRYTWHASGKSSRFDYLFISEHLLNDINKCKINPGLHSDHNILSLELNANKINRGNVLWKFNIKLLKDMDYVKLVKNTVEQCKNDFCQQENKSLGWELTKLRIRSATIPYCIKRKKERTAFKLNLENELLRLQQELDYNNSDITLDNYNSTKRELKQIEIAKHTAIFVGLKSTGQNMEKRTPNSFFLLKK